jgi:uncharacterized repeat protein (TIGR04138 family)
MFVNGVWRFAFDRAGHDPDTSHVGAVDVCRSLRDLASSYFNDQHEAQQLLHEWGVRRGEDVARILSALVAAGFVRVRDGDLRDGFQGRFSLADLFDRY